MSRAEKTKELTPAQLEAQKFLLQNYGNPCEARDSLRQLLAVLNYTVQSFEDNCVSTDATIGFMHLLSLCSHLNEIA